MFLLSKCKLSTVKLAEQSKILEEKNPLLKLHPQKYDALRLDDSLTCKKQKKR